MLLEIGYGHTTDWTVQVWDTANVGQEQEQAPQIILSQAVDRGEALAEAALELRRLRGAA